MIEFHQKHPISSYLKGKWEGKTFNYDLNKNYLELGPSYIKSVPMGNDYTFDFIKALFVNEKLGEDNHTDFLVLSFSTTDYVGHKFGPDSEQIKNTYKKLDKNVADLIHFLDQRVGIGNYVLALTSDHGATTSIAEVEKNRLKGGLFSSKEMLIQLNKKLEIIFGVPEIIKRYANMQLYINYPIIDSLNISDNEVFLQSKKWLIRQPYIDNTYNLSTLKNSLNSNKIQMLINGLHPKRSGDIFLTLSPGFMDWSTKTGTTHGSHYNYDSHVPLFFYGANIQPKQIYRNIKITDIAPTLSILLKSAFPNACTGNPISEVFKNKD